MSADDGHEVFDRDYLDFYEEELNGSVSDEECELIAMLTGLEAGQRVLDAPCGHGRIARRLAARGAQVVGVDRSEVFLQRARESAARGDVEVDYRAMDLRELPFVEEYDLVVNWFTSFGYELDDDGQRHVLWRLFRALKPGGQLLLETLNVLEGGLTDHELTTVKELRDDDGAVHMMIDRARFDPHEGRLCVRRFVERPGRALRELHWSLRLFSVPELAQWLRDAGFESVQAYGADAEVFRCDSRRLVMVARKPLDP